ncbi:hypothetical protein RND71_004767 [Anisodus tanguticus]|uniref:TF-B3 domain-containing protein n=1 Tax=Anisodus tanguticus TaxID=243964 RepID=A0AAE1SQQ7_9SOLA|nr:hypothetical protein RND71_004767 [Anisodus tanguticus]
MKEKWNLRFPSLMKVTVTENMQIEEEEEGKEENSKKFEFNDKPNPFIMSSSKAFPNAEEAATHNPFGKSHFVFTVKPYCLTNGYLGLCAMNCVTDKPSPNIRSSNKSFPHAEAATHKPFDYSHFVCTVRPYCLSYDLLCIPRNFARANGLMNKKCDLIIRDERQMSWSLRLCCFGTGVCIKGGWHEFRDTNCLKKGDRVMFEVVTNGEKPIWQFHG